MLRFVPGSRHNRSDVNIAIARLTWSPVKLELDQPFAISGGSHETAALVVVRLELDDGNVGLGEAAPLPAYNGETLAHVERALSDVKRCIEGTRMESWSDLYPRVQALVVNSGSACCAVETALLDALARRQGVALQHWFGPAGELRLHTDVTIPLGDVEVAESTARKWWGRGFRTLKVKVADVDLDVQRVAAVHRGAPQARLLLDANAGLSAAEALRLIDELRRRNITITLFEQPVPRGDWSGLQYLAQHGVRLALDESVVTAEDVLEAQRELGSEHVVNVTLMKAGVSQALRVVAAARFAGMGLMIGGMVESSLAMTVSACLASGLGGFEFLDLDTPLFLQDSPFIGGLRFDGDRLDLSAIDEGHGVSLG
jgi:L-Ala-D/L-Glu epimerase